MCLSHHPGVSKAILDAAGPTVENECNKLGKDHSNSQAKPLNIFFRCFRFHLKIWGVGRDDSLSSRFNTIHNIGFTIQYYNDILNKTWLKQMYDWKDIAVYFKDTKYAEQCHLPYISIYYEIVNKICYSNMV